LTLQLYILRQLVLSVGFSVAGIAMVVLPTVAIQAIHKLGSVSMLAVLEYLPLVLVELAPYLLPMAFLLGVVATYGRLAAERELVAIRMAGVHPAMLSLPALVVGALLTLGTNHLVTRVSPEWKYEQRNYLRKAEKDAFQNLGQGRTALEFGDCSLEAEDHVGNAFYNVLLDLSHEGGEELTVTADVATLDIRDETLFIEFQHARVMGDNARLYGEFPFWSCPLDVLFPVTLKDKSRPKYMTSPDIRAYIASEELSVDEEHEYVYELHRRDALSVTYLLFLLLGIPTGIVLRSSTQLGAFTGAVGYGFLYYVLALQLGKVLARTGMVPPIGAAWATNILFLVVGLILFHRALWR
jgi:lipopolysaccharide export system permease protein